MSTATVSKDALLRRRVFEELVVRSPTEARFRVSLIEELLSDLESADGKACGGDKRLQCERQVSEHIAELRRLPQDSAAVAEFEARLLVLQKDPESAERLLSRECDKYELSVSCLRTWLTVSLSLNHAQSVERALTKLKAAACSSASACAGEFDWIGEQMAARQNWAGAALYFLRAAKEQPTEARWQKVVDASERAGLAAWAEDARANAATFRRNH